MDPVMVGKQSFTLLFPDLLRPLSVDERGRLRDSIQARGKVVVPVVTDEDGGVIDGGNRVILAAELGLDEVPVDVYPGLTQDQKRDLALSLNEDRRHLSAEDRRELALRLRQEGKSYREIGERLGVSHPTAMADVREAGGKSLPPQPDGGSASGEEYSPPEAVRGRDGKQYPARKAARPEPFPEPPSPPLPFPEESAEPDEDDAGADGPEEAEQPQPLSPPVTEAKRPRAKSPKDPEEVWVRLTHEVWSHVNGVRDLGGIQVLAADWTEKGRRSEALAYRQLGETFLGWADFLDGETSRE